MIIMKNLLLVIDMQNDFINGALGTAKAASIVPQVAEMIQNLRGDVIYTQDTHFENYLHTQEGKNLPVPHCIKSTQGWELHPYIADACKKKGAKGIEKLTFGACDLPQFLHQSYPEGIEKITLVGLCTDICVISNALLLKAFFPETPIAVNGSCCAGVTPQSHTTALESMKACQISIES